MSTPDTTSVQRPQAPAERSTPQPPGGRRGIVRAIGLGLITGAADDDPSAIGTYASAGRSLDHPFCGLLQLRSR
jgi:hypothetical protein